MKRDNKKALYERIMTSIAKEVKKTLNEAEKDPYDHLYDKYSRNAVRRLAQDYLNDYYRLCPEEIGEYPNWGELDNTGYYDLQEAWMAIEGENWASKIADEEYERYALEHGWNEK